MPQDPNLKNTSENQRAKWREYKREQRSRLAAKPLSRFPSKFFEIMNYFEMMQDRAQELTVTLENEQQAQSLKFKWYDFKKALKHSAGESHAHWGDFSEKILLRIRGATMLFCWRDHDQELRAFNEMEIPDPFASGNFAEKLSLEHLAAEVPAVKSDEEVYRKYFPKEQAQEEKAEQLSLEEAMRKEMGL